MFKMSRMTSEMWRALFKGLWVILYLLAGTDLVQPIKVVQDSYVYNWVNKMLA